MRSLSLPEVELSLFTAPKTGGTTIASWVHFLRTDGQEPEANVYDAGWLWSDEVQAEKLRIRRDPVDRFVSGYRNFRDKRGLRLGFSEFLEKFEKLMEEDPNVHHHFQAQHLYYPHAIEDYDYVFDFSRFGDIKQFLEQRTGRRLPTWQHQKARFSNFEVTGKQVDRLREFYAKDYELGFCEPSRPEVTAASFSFRERERREDEEEFQLIVSTMRSGSSLCGHLLAEAGWVWFAGETHHHLIGESHLQAASEVIRAEGGGSRPEAPPCDKTLGSSTLPDGGEFIAERASKIYLLLRHPLAVWRSQKKAGWKGCNLKAMADQFQLMRELVEKVKPEKLQVLSYYDLTSPAGRERLFGRSLDHYETNCKTGKSGWGDIGPLIASGEIRETTPEDDLRRAMPEIWMDLGDADLARAMGEFQRILKAVCREELDVAWPEEELLAAKILRIGEGPQREESLRLSLSELEQANELPCENEVFEKVISEELVHRLEPPRLKAHLAEFRRVLSPGGVVRLSTPDLAFLMKVTAGEEDEFVAWYREQFLGKVREGAGDRAAVVNHLMRSWGHRYCYDFAALKEALEGAGFEGVREVSPGDDESKARMPEGFYAKERLVIEATAMSEEEWLAKLDREADCLYVDCGYHRGGGFQELTAKGIVDARFRCIGFEPNPDLPLPNWVTQAAVGAFDGEATLQIQSPKEGPYSEMGSTILPEFKDALKEVEKTRGHETGVFEHTATVPVVRLSGVLQDAHEELKPVRTVVKIDIEGAEKEVVEDLLETGAIKLIDELHIEWHAWTGVYPKSVPEELTSRMREQGVKVVLHH